MDAKINQKANKEANMLNEIAELEVNKLDEIIFNGKPINFFKSNAILHQSILGVLIEQLFQLSFLLPEQIIRVMSQGGLTLNKKWNLIYKAT